MNALILLAFIAITSLSYAVQSLGVFITALVVCTLLLVCIPRARTALKQMTLLLKVGAVMFVLVFVSNWLFDNAHAAALYSIRLLAIYAFTLLFLILMGQRRLIDAVVGLFAPLKIVGVDTNYIRIITTTSFCIAPEINAMNLQVKHALMVKGHKGIIREPAIFIEVYMHAILDLVYDLMRALEVKCELKKKS
jgi:hypothetical protein